MVLRRIGSLVNLSNSSFDKGDDEERSAHVKIRRISSLVNLSNPSFDKGEDEEKSAHVKVRRSSSFVNLSNSSFEKRDDEEKSAHVKVNEQPTSAEIESFEKDLLIARLRSDASRKAAALSAVEAELHALEMKRRKESLLHRLEIEQYRRRAKGAEALAKAMRHDLDDHNAISFYAGFIKRAAPLVVDSRSSYALQLQAQLCKAMHEMGVMEKQIMIANEYCEAVIAGVREESTKSMEESASREAGLRQRISQLEYNSFVSELPSTPQTSFNSETFASIAVEEKNSTKNQTAPNALSSLRVTLTETVKAVQLDKEETISSLQQQMESNIESINNLESSLAAQENTNMRLKLHLEKVRRVGREHTQDHKKPADSKRRHSIHR